MKKLVPDSRNTDVVLALAKCRHTVSAPEGPEPDGEVRSGRWDVEPPTHSVAGMVPAGLKGGPWWARQLAARDKRVTGQKESQT